MSSDKATSRTSLSMRLCIMVTRGPSPVLVTQVTWPMITGCSARVRAEQPVPEDGGPLMEGGVVGVGSGRSSEPPESRQEKNQENAKRVIDSGLIPFNTCKCKLFQARQNAPLNTQVLKL